MSSQKTQRCENCFKQFPQSKINSHFSYCRRNFKVCPLCRQMYDINFKQDHQKQFHSSEQCQYCKLPFPSQQIQNHITNCNSKPRLCNFCEQQIPKQMFGKHVEQCGARTQICPVCNKNIMLKEYDSHFNKCWQESLPNEEDNRYSNSRSVRFNENIYGSVSPRQTPINSIISPGGTFGFYQPTGITSVPQLSTVGTNGRQHPANFIHSNQIIQPLVQPIPHQSRVQPIAQSHNRIQPQQQLSYQNIPQNINRDTIHSSIQSNSTALPRIHQNQSLTNPAQQLYNTQVPTQINQSRNPNQPSVLNDDQNQMMQRAMMESLQNQKFQKQFYQPQYQPTSIPQNYQQQQQQQHINHQNQLRSQQQAGFGFTAQTLSDKTLLQDIEMQEQIINSMKKNQQSNNIQGSFMRINPGNTRL